MDLSTETAGSTFDSADTRVATVPLGIAVAMLIAAACLAGPFASWLDLIQHKSAIPLRAPLASLDERVLAPYRVVRRDAFDQATLEALGTDMYLSWHIEDETLPPNDPLRTAHLLVTYDSGGNSLVPHTPDVCWLGSGYEPAQPHENIEFDLPSLSGKVASVPARVCTFVKTAQRNRSRHTIVYTFHCNGRFVATRTGVRILVNAPTSRYAYFSKVEITFHGATRAQGIDGAGKLLNRLLPALVRGHWPDFQAAEDAARSEGSRR